MLMGAEKVVEQQIPVSQFGLSPIQNQLTVQSSFRGGGGGLAAVIRLRRAQSHERVRALLQSLPNEKLKLASFVATEG